MCLLVIKSRRFQLIRLGYKTQHNTFTTHQFLFHKLKMEKFALITKITQKTLGRDHTFFSNPNRYRHWTDDKATLDPVKITDLSLECIGYGEFYPTEIADRFIDYFGQCTKQMPNLKHMKLKINGFDLKDCPKLIQQVCKIIDRIPPNTLKLLQIQTTRLINCDSIDDFGALLKTAIRIGRRQRQGSLKTINPFQTLVLQFADWQFIYQDQKSQPNPQTLKNQLGIIQDEAFDADGFCFKKFRLEMSTWYYTQKEADIFFHTFKVDQFHSAMDYFVRTCYSLMPDLQYFQFDLRNWHSDFQLPKLRDSIMMIPKQGAQNMSINSKNISRYKKKKDEVSRINGQVEYDDDDIILFERHIVI